MNKPNVIISGVKNSKIKVNGTEYSFDENGVQIQLYNQKNSTIIDAISTTTIEIPKPKGLVNQIKEFIINLF